MQVTSCNGCTDNTITCFPVREIDIPINPASDSICNGDTAILLLNCDTTLTYTWTGSGLCTTCGTDGCAIAYPNFSSDYTLTITDGLCSVDTTFHIGVQQLPNLAFGYTTDCKSLDVQFQNGSSNGVNYMWDFGDNQGTSNAENPTYTYDSSGIYVVTLKSADGCDVDTSMTITANAIFEELDTTTVSCFKAPVELNPVILGDYTYTWSPSQFLDSANVANPTATVTTNTWFYVTISQADLPGCEIVDSILVKSPEDFTITAPPDSNSCKVILIPLVATTNVDPNSLNIIWINGMTGDTVATGYQYDVNPDSTTTFTVVATNSDGCSTSDQVTIFKPADPFILTASNDTSYCDIQSITLSAMSNVDPFMTYQWVNSTGDTIGEGSTILVTPGSVSTYQVIGTDSIGCQLDEAVTLTPTFFNIDVTDAQIICLGGEATLCVTDNNNQNLSYTWVPQGCDGTIHAPCITVCPEDTTAYSVVVTNDDVGCIDTLNTNVTVALFEPSDVIVTAIPDTIILTFQYSFSLISLMIMDMYGLLRIPMMTFHQWAILHLFHKILVL
jgi:PKD repeat protein